VSGCVDPKKGLTLAIMESIYEYVLTQLQVHKGKWSEVAEGSGVPKRSIEKIARREWNDPGVLNIEKLAKYFRQTDEAMH
jgi:transcriptional regulator with XRE-family HTH domain